jgi:hypothetical protein
MVRRARFDCEFELRSDVVMRWVSVAVVALAPSLGCGPASAPKLVGPRARRVVVPCDPKLSALTPEVCRKACPPAGAGEELVACDEAPSTELVREQLAPMASALLLCRFEVRR